MPESKAVSWRIQGDCVVAHGDCNFENVNILNQLVGSPTPQRKDKNASSATVRYHRYLFLFNRSRRSYIEISYI